MTEDEAKTKWCPHVRFVGWETFRDGEKPASANRIPNKEGSIDPMVACIGSDCMMWRHLESNISVKKAFAGEECPIESGGGYCGLAGKP